MNRLMLWVLGQSGTFFAGHSETCFTVPHRLVPLCPTALSVCNFASVFIISLIRLSHTIGADGYVVHSVFVDNGTQLY